MNAETRADRIKRIRQYGASLYRHGDVDWLCDQLEASLAAGTFAEGVEAVAKAAERGFRSCGSVDLPGEIRALASKPAVVGARQMQILKIPQITADLMDTIDGLIDACDCPSLTAAEVRTCIKETLRTFLTENKPPAESAQPTPLEHNYVDKGFQWRVCDKCGMVENLEKKTVCKGVLPKLRPAVGLVEWKPKGEPTPAPASVQSEPVPSWQTIRYDNETSQWVAYSPLLNIYGMGESASLASESLRDAVKLYVDTLKIQLQQLATAPPAAPVGDLKAKLERIAGIRSTQKYRIALTFQTPDNADILWLCDELEAALPNAAKEDRGQAH